MLQLCCCGHKVSSSAGIQRKWASHFSRNIFHCFFCPDVFNWMTWGKSWGYCRVPSVSCYTRKTNICSSCWFWCFGVLCLGLNKHVSSLWTCVSGLNDTVIRHGGLLDFIQNGQDDIHSRVKNLNSSLNQVSRDLQSLSEYDLTGELLLPLILFGGVFSYSVISQHSSTLIWITWKEGCGVFIGLMYWLCLGDHQSLQQCSQTDVDLLD